MAKVGIVMGSDSDLSRLSYTFFKADEQSRRDA